MACKFPEFNLNVGCKKCPIKDCVASEQPDPKPLARFLVEYIDQKIQEHQQWISVLPEKWLEQALEAYQSTEQVTIEITKL